MVFYQTLDPFEVDDTFLKVYDDTSPLKKEKVARDEIQLSFPKLKV